MIAWTRRNVIQPEASPPSEQQALFLRLGNQEILQVARLLDLRDISMLYLSGCRAVWSMLSTSVEEAQFIPASGRLRAVLSINPFPLLSKLPSLHTVKLLRVSWSNFGGDTSPFLCLPPTLRCLDYEVIRPIHPNSTTWSVGYLDIDYNAAFPHLERLRILTNGEWHSKPNWIQKLPSSLTVLSLRNIDHPREALAYICGEAMAFSYESSFEHWIPFSANASVSLASRTLPFPSLVFLEFYHSYCHQNPILSLLPPKLTRLQWKTLTSYEPFDEAILEAHRNKTLHNTQHNQHTPDNILAGLRSLSISSPDSALLDELNQCTQLTKLTISGGDANTVISRLPLPTSLKHLQVQLVPVHAPYHAHLFSRLNTAGVHLTELRLSMFDESVFHAPEFSTLLFASLVTIELAELGSSSISFLPAGLRTLRTWTLSKHKEMLDEENARKFPRGLTTLKWLGLHIELGYIPLLPRTLQKLLFMPVNQLGIGTKWVTAEIQEEASRQGILHLYDSIKPETNLLFGLPPNLRRLTVLCPDMVFGANFGAFLPRSLLTLYTGDHPRHGINIERSVSSWLGLNRSATETDLERAIKLFPPRCVSTLFFRQQLLIPLSIALTDMKPYCPYLTVVAKDQYATFSQ